MKKLGNKGFSLLELMAVLVISSIILVPLLSSFSDSVKINNRSIAKRITSSVAEGAFYGLEKIDFIEFRTLVDAANSGGTYYVELNADECVNLSTTTAQNLCTNIFSTIWNNLSFDSTEFKIYLFDYALTSAEHAAIYGNESIEGTARSVIEANADIVATLNGTDVTSLVRVVIWLDYYDNPDSYYVLVGLIADE